MEPTNKTLLAELAPWIAIIVTLIVSVLIPTITQIVSARSQEKRDKKLRHFNLDKERLDRYITAYESFLIDVGSALANGTGDELAKAGASIARLYLYVPANMHIDLEVLHEHIHERRLDKAEDVFLIIAPKLQVLLNDE